MTYKFECPTKRGYKAFTVDRKTFQKIVPTREFRFMKVKGYVKDKHIILHYIPTPIGCILTTLLYPLGVLMEGFANYKETWEDMVLDTWFAEKRGKYSGDDVHQRDNDNTFEELLLVAKFI